MDRIALVGLEMDGTSAGSAEASERAGAELTEPEASAASADGPFVKWRGWLARHWHLPVTILSLVFAFVTLLFGSGMLLRPRVHIACGAIDLRIPAAVKMQHMLLNFLTYSKDAKAKLAEEVRRRLQEYGMSSEKIDMVAAEYAKPQDEKMSFAALPLEPHEQNMLWMAMMNSSVEMNKLMRDMFMPDAVLFFEILNSGRGAAKNTHVVIRIAGRVGNHELDSDSKVAFCGIVDGRFTCDMDSLAPGSRTRGIIWFNGGRGRAGEAQNEITVTFDHGTTRRSFGVDEFYLGNKE